MNTEPKTSPMTAFVQALSSKLTGQQSQTLLEKITQDAAANLGAKHQCETLPDAKHAVNYEYH